MYVYVRVCLSWWKTWGNRNGLTHTLDAGMICCVHRYMHEPKRISTKHTHTYTTVSFSAHTHTHIRTPCECHHKVWNEIIYAQVNTTWNVSNRAFAADTKSYRTEKLIVAIPCKCILYVHVFKIRCKKLKKKTKNRTETRKKGSKYPIREYWRTVHSHSKVCSIKSRDILDLYTPKSLQ